MANVEYETSNVTLDVNIKLHDITEEAYRDIVNYISQRTSGENCSGIIEQVAKPREQVTVRLEVKKPKKNPVPDKRLQNLEVLMGQYKMNPEKFELKEMTAEEFLKNNPEYHDISTKSIAKKLQHLGVERIKKPLKNGNYKGTINYYMIPIVKQMLGTKLYNARKIHMYSLGEVADMIGYSMDVIRSWEKGTATPSTEALKALKRVYGESVADI